MSIGEGICKPAAGIKHVIRQIHCLLLGSNRRAEIQGCRSGDCLVRLREEHMSTKTPVGMIVGIMTFFMIVLTAASHVALVFAGERFYNGGAGGTGVRELPLYVAKDLGIFDKYGLDVETIATNGGSPLIQGLVGGSIQSASVAAMAPIRAIRSGANLAIVAGFLNKNMYSFVSRQQIQKPADLRGKTIGIASFGAANEFSVLMVLKALGIGPNEVNLRVAGGSLARLAGIERGTIDATVVPHSNNVIATAKGMRIFADLAKVVKEFPDGTVVMKRNLDQRERAAAKRFLQALSEAVYRLRTEPQLQERVVANVQKRMRVNRKYAEEVYEGYREVFSYPPRVGRDGLGDVLEIISRQTGNPQADLKIDRYVDESIMDELAAEGFFKKLEARNN
jgi:ABC-type nitrate/sulfonate/bicarbonate transport system substrate-binding protein